MPWAVVLKGGLVLVLATQLRIFRLICDPQLSAVERYVFKGRRTAAPDIMSAEDWAIGGVIEVEDDDAGSNQVKFTPP